MLPLTHFIASLILVAILFPFFSFYSLIIFIGGFIIDLDHAFFYWIKLKSFDIIKEYNYFKGIALKNDVKEYKNVLRVFHSFEFIILVTILSFHYKVFVMLLIGLIAHTTMDIIYEYPKFKTLAGFSLIWYIIKNVKKQKK